MYQKILMIRKIRLNRMNRLYLIDQKNLMNHQYLKIRKNLMNRRVRYYLSFHYLLMHRLSLRSRMFEFQNPLFGLELQIVMLLWLDYKI
jgi:hypothetical protein